MPASGAESAGVEGVPVLFALAGPSVLCPRDPVAFGAADTGQGLAEELIYFVGRKRRALRRSPDRDTADLRQTLHACAELDLGKEAKVRVGDAIEMFRPRWSLVLARFEPDVAGLLVEGQHSLGASFGLSLSVSLAKAWCAS